MSSDTDKLREYNAWRRGGDGKQPNPTELGELIERVADRLDALDSPSTKHEINDALLIAAEGQAQGDKSAYALAAATLADALRQEREARQQAQIRLERAQDAQARAGVDARREAAEQMRALRAAAQAVVDRWDSPAWKDLPHTGEYIARLREALDGDAPTSPRETLTDEQIDAAVAAERDALLDHIYEYGTNSEGILRLVRNLARRAHGIGQEGGDA